MRKSIYLYDNKVNEPLKKDYKIILGLSIACFLVEYAISCLP